MPNIRSRYRSVDDASMRHSNTYVALCNAELDIMVPYFVAGVTGSNSMPSFILRHLDNGQTTEVSMDNPRLVIDRPTLGMVNQLCSTTNKGVAMWYTSSPSRQIKRSLDFSFIRGMHLLKSEVLDHLTVNVGRTTRQSHDVAVSTFFNKIYPSFEEANEKILRLEALSVAFSPKFALAMHPSYGVVLMYKTLLVGWVTNMTPQLGSGFEYLQEQLEENVHGNV
jgi:hypothetical protein